MPWKNRRLPTVAAVALVAALTSAASPATAPDRFANVLGDPWQFPADARAVVLVFVARDCPISNAFAPEIVRLARAYEPAGVRFCVVYADPAETADAAAAHARAFGFESPAILDPGMIWVARTGVAVTPEAAVLTPAGDVAYRGRIDDRYADFGKRRPTPTQRDLKDAVDSVLAGRVVATPRVRAVGCAIDRPAATRPAASGGPGRPIGE